MLENDLTEINTLHHSTDYPGYSIHLVVFVVARCLLLCNAHCKLWLPFLSIIYESCAMLDVTVYSIRPSTSHRKCASTNRRWLSSLCHILFYFRDGSFCRMKSTKAVSLIAIVKISIFSPRSDLKWTKRNGLANAMEMWEEKTRTSAQEWMRQQIVKRCSHLVKNVTRVQNIFSMESKVNEMRNDIELNQHRFVVGEKPQSRKWK